MGAEFNESLATAAFPNGAKIALYGADNPDALRGVGLDGVVLDELADMRPSVWGEIVRPCLTDRMGWSLLIGTPKGLNLLSERYYKALADPNWYAATFTCFDTAALEPEEIERARGEMTPNQFAQEMLCDFQAAVSDALIPLDRARVASERNLGLTEYCFAPKIMGVDVARYGDDSSVIVKRQGLAVLGLDVMKGLNTMELAGRVAAAIHEFHPDAVFIDVVGVGAGVVDRLNQLGFDVVPCEAAGAPRDRRFLNLRAEAWWELAEWLKAGRIPPDERLLADLGAPTYSCNSAGKIQLESKDEMKKRGMPSPDLGDALALTFAYPVHPSRLDDAESYRSTHKEDPMAAWLKEWR